MTIGIYKIINKINNKFYIGSSRRSIEKRLIIHKCKLKADKHANKHLQAAWNQYGEENFIFEVYEEMTVLENILKREEDLINELRSYDKNIGYNKMKKTSQNPMLNKKTIGMTGKKHSENSKEKIKLNHADFSGEKNGRAKLDWEKVEEIRKLYFQDKVILKIIAEKFNIGISTVFHVINNETWIKND